ncbi:MAG: phosphoribosylaminoimidazole carboxylase ATPase subunit PurK [Phormidesmis priestleyi Ana]|uniref:N5-carboxyaminoimidazole ribonucleotide synthase n=1 Tax=Phormidesmis priestleyi Ana TaxID=1666911 RepID=A0A0P7ZKZ8_9CYAN|nr:MAG: phosphoribosylaminoimidazole carboxylase ATPase subunit PurK [Phormidesmis priestleyi Ana]
MAAAISEVENQVQNQLKSVGVVGGGQLAWMMADGAKALGLELLVQTPNADDPACAIAHRTFIGGVADAVVTAKMAQYCDVITFENEFIDLPALRQLTDSDRLFYPQLDCLAPLLDKYDQRQYCDSIGLPSPRFATLQSKADLPFIEALVGDIGLPLVLKTRRHGYDGQGTFILHNLAQITQTWQKLGYQPVLLEAFVEFEKELAVMVARSFSGEVAVYPVVETQQVDQVCRRVIAPAQVPPSVVDQVEAIATQLVNRLGVVGILGIELFVTKSQQVLINEIAPRTHNSGHYTLDACNTSQFEQQLRAVSGLSLGSTDWKVAGTGAVMVNLLGTETRVSDYAEKRAALAQIPNAFVYWYGKRQARLGRKMGHVTVLTDAIQESTAVEAIIQTVEQRWY